MANCERGVSCHQEMATRGGNQRRDQPDQVIVHVARVTQRRSTGRHNLNTQPHQHRVRHALQAMMGRTVDTSEFSCPTVGLSIRSLSTAILLRAVLSSTTTQSALSVSRFNVSIELYG